ncbi:unnamed protein product, partial [Prorocentrum cordatum]
AQRPLLDKPNADVTAAAANWGVARDGVSGVAPRFNPQDLSWGLRNCLRFLLRQRFHWAGDAQEFDAQVVREIGGDVRSMAADAPAAWTARLLQLAFQTATLYGTTTVVFFFSVSGAKMAYESVEVILTGTDDDVHAAAGQMVKCAQLRGAPEPDDISIVIG